MEENLSKTLIILFFHTGFVCLLLFFRSCSQFIFQPYLVALTLWVIHLFQEHRPKNTRPTTVYENGTYYNCFKQIFNQILNKQDIPTSSKNSSMHFY